VSIRASLGVRKLRSVTRSERAVLDSLADHANKDLVAFPSQATIGEEIGVGERWVRRLLDRLVAKGLIEVVRKSNRRFGNRYLLLFPVELTVKAQPVKMAGGEFLIGSIDPLHRVNRSLDPINNLLKTKTRASAPDRPETRTHSRPGPSWRPESSSTRDPWHWAMCPHAVKCGDYATCCELKTKEAGEKPEGMDEWLQGFKRRVGV
jgi:DNA-binding Lrp family transcriptional regulator